MLFSAVASIDFPGVATLSVSLGGEESEAKRDETSHLRRKGDVSSIFHCKSQKESLSLAPPNDFFHS